MSKGLGITLANECGSEFGRGSEFEGPLCRLRAGLDVSNTPRVDTYQRTVSEHQNQNEGFRTSMDKVHTIHSVQTRQYLAQDTFPMASLAVEKMRFSQKPPASPSSTTYLSTSRTCSLTRPAITRWLLDFHNKVYESSEFMKRLVYYPRSQRFFQ